MGTNIPQIWENWRVRLSTRIERRWYGEDGRFLEVEDAKKELVVVPQGMSSYRLIGRLNSRKGGEPNLLRPEALGFLNLALGTWHDSLPKGYAPLRAAITSLYRPARLQKSILAAEGAYRAVGTSVSSHLSGGTFDVSIRSYYWLRGGEFLSVASWRHQGLMFDPYPMRALRKTLECFAHHGQCNLVVENWIEGWRIEPSVLHVCVNPNLFRGQKP